MGERGIAGRLRLAGQSRCDMSVGKFERLLQLLVILRLGDPRALFGCMFLDIFTVSGPIFLKLTLLPLVK